MDPETLALDCVAHRYSSYDTPFWARPNTQPGRWHSVGDGPTQYLATTTDGSWAELIRNEELTTEDEVALVRMQMWAVQIHDAMIVDYSTFEKAAEAGLDPEALINDDQSRTREEGARLRNAGYRGVLAPSAALPGELNLTLFGPRTISSWGRPPLLASAVPAMIIATGSPPPRLLARVRQIGTAHDGFLEYQARRRARSSREDLA
jgi:RES domain-containing protein